MENRITLIFDIECYSNYWLVLFYCPSTNQYFSFDDTTLDDCKKWLWDNRSNYKFVGHNIKGYDLYHFSYIMTQENVNATTLKILSDQIIKGDLKKIYSKLEKSLRLFYNRNFKVIDTSFYFTTAGTQKDEQKTTVKSEYVHRFISLKELGARLDHHKLQELPYDVTKPLNDEQKQKTYDYCVNDVEITTAIHKVISSELSARSYFSKQFPDIDFYNCKTSSAGEKYLAAKYANEANLDYWYVLKEAKENNQPETFELLKLQSLDLKFHNPKIQSWYDFASNTIFSPKTVRGQLKRTIFDEGLLELGSGGVHFAIKGVFEEDDEHLLIDEDVTGHYPAMIRNFEIFPKHLNKEIFIKIINEMIDTRVEIKKRSKEAGITNDEKANLTVVSNALKLVLNSTLFGKLGFSWSFLYYVGCLETVTTIGQALLLKLYDELTYNGFKVFYINTDGLTTKVPKARMTEYNTICDNWQKETDLNLEREFYSNFLVNNVNNYLAKSRGGKFKGKGEFAFLYLETSQKLKVAGNKRPAISIKAAEKFLFENIPLEETIKNEKDIFLFKKVFRARRDSQIFIGEEQTQNTVRYYHSIDGKYLKKIFIKSNKESKLADKATLFLNKDDDFIFPDNIDYDYYIGQSEKLLKEARKLTPDFPSVIETKLKVSEKTKLKNAKKALDILLTENNHYWFFNGVFDKDSKPIAETNGYPFKRIQYNKDNKNDIILNNSYVCLNPVSIASNRKDEGSITEVTSITIEFDEMPLKEQLAWYKKTVPCTIVNWSGNKSLHGHFIFTRGLSDDELQEIRILISLKIGEACQSTYTKKSQFVRLPFGKNHDTNKEQVILKPMQDRLEPHFFIAWLQSLPTRFIGHSQEKLIDKTAKKLNPTSFNVKKKIKQQQKLVSFFEEIFKERSQFFIKNHRLSWGEIEVEGYAFETICPNHEQHTTGKKGFCYFVTETGHVFTKCLHSSCEGIKTPEFLKLDSIELEIENNIEEGDVEIKTDIVINEASQTVKDVFDSTNFFNLVIAPTGSGKTTAALNYINQSYLEGFSCIYVANNKEDLANAYNQFVITFGEKENVTKMESTRELSQDSLVVQETSKDISAMKVVFTHKTYLKRRGLDNRFYYLFTWILNNKPIVIIDEFNIFIDSLHLTFALSQMSNQYKPKGQKELQYKKLETCPSYSRNKNFCKNCFLSKNLKFRVDQFGNSRLIIENCTYKNYEEATIDFKTGSSILIDNMEITEVKNDLSYLRKKTDFFKHDFNNDEAFENKNDLLDLLNCSFAPKIVRTFPTEDNIEVSPESTTELEDKSNLRYPSRSCGEYFNCIDLSPLQFLQNYSSKIFGLCVNDKKQSQEIISTIFPKIEKHIVSRDHDKLDGIQILKVETSNTELYDFLFENLHNSEDIKTLWFEANINSAKKLQSKYGKKYNSILAVENKATFHKNNYKFNEKSKILITNSLGALGASVNFYHHNLVIINCENYKPQFAFPFCENKEEILTRIIEERLETIQQNAGRVFRKEKIQVNSYKTVLLLNCDLDLYNLVKERLNPLELAKKTFNRNFYRNQNLLQQILKFNLNGGEINQTIEQEIEEFKKLQKESKNGKMNYNQIICHIIEKGKSYKNWTSFVKANKVRTRYDKDQIVNIKEQFTKTKKG